MTSIQIVRFCERYCCVRSMSVATSVLILVRFLCFWEMTARNITGSDHELGCRGIHKDNAPTKLLDFSEEQRILRIQHEIITEAFAGLFP